MAKRKYTVYSHRNLLNGKVYVGMTTLSPGERWRSDGSGYKSQHDFWHDICMFGWDNFAHTIHASGISKCKAKKMEKDLIKRFDSRNYLHGYNRTNGGETGNLGSVGAYKDHFGYDHPTSVRVYCPELDEEFGSINQAALFIGVTPGALQSCLSGRSKTSGKHFQTGEPLHWVRVQ